MLIGSGVFDPRGSKNWGVPLTRLVALTAVLHYRADCDGKQLNYISEGSWCHLACAAVYIATSAMPAVMLLQLA